MRAFVHQPVPQELMFVRFERHIPGKMMLAISLGMCDPEVWQTRFAGGSPLAEKPREVPLLSHDH